MSDSMANLVVKLTADNKGLRRGFKGAQSMLSGLAKSALAIGAPIAAALGGRAILDAAKTQQQAEKKLEGVLAATGGAAGLTQKQIQDYASELQGLTGIGDEVTTNAAAMLATFKEIKGDHFKEALARAQDLAATLDGDVKGATIQIGKALNDPIKGMAALAESGVSFTEQQKEMVRNFQESGDIASAQRVILDELAGEFGGVAAEMKDPIEGAKGALGDMAESLGFVVMPSIHAAANAFTEWLGSITPAQEKFKALGEDIAFTFRNFGSLAKISLIDVVLTGLEYFPMLEAPIEKLAGIFTGTFAGVKAFFGAFVQNVISGFTEIGNVVKAISAGASAAFSAISSGDFSGAAGAFSDAFLSELASQTDAKSGGNPFTEFSDAFTQAQQQTAAMFKESGGLGGALKDEKQRLLDSIAEDERKRDEAKNQAKKTVEESGPGSVPVSDSEKTVGGVGAVDARSTEAFSAIQAAIRGGQKDPIQEKQLKVAEKQAKAMNRIEQNTRNIQPLIDVALP